MYTVTLSIDMIRTIDLGLQELPFKLAAPVIAELNKQLSDKAASEEKPDVK